MQEKKAKNKFKYYKFFILFAAFVEPDFTIVYTYLWVLGFGGLLYKYREQAAKKIRAIKLSPILKFAILGYAMVLLEEVFAAFANNLNEGFELSLLIVRIFQFQAFNVFAFTGFIFGFYFLTKWFKYSKTEIFFLAGIWGLYGEGIIFSLIGNPLAFFFWTPIMILVYGLIITPSIMSIETEGKRELTRFIRYPLTYVLLFLFSIIPISVLVLVRTAFPGAFPPPELIPL